MKTREEGARDLAHKHYQVEAGVTQIFRITGAADVEDRPTEPIKLLEVNQQTIPSGIMPLRFGPSPASGIDYPSVILEVTPDEYRRIASKELPLPHGWTVADLIPRPPGTGGG